MQPWLKHNRCRSIHLLFLPFAKVLKKISLILLISIYAISALGIGVTGFYCCGKLQSLNITLNQNSTQNKDNKNRCCQSKYQFFKIKDNHVAADHINSPVKLFTEANLFTASYQPVLYSFHKIIFTNFGNAPPLYNGVPRHISNCTFQFDSSLLTLLGIYRGYWYFSHTIICFYKILFIVFENDAPEKKAD